MENKTITINLTWKGVIVILLLALIILPITIAISNRPELSIILLPFIFFDVILIIVLIAYALIYLLIKLATKLKLVEIE